MALRDVFLATLLIIAQSTSKIGSPNTNIGSAITTAVYVFATPKMEIIDNIYPRKFEPVSPIKVLAGEKLNGKNPTNEPHNAVINMVDKQFISLLGDAAILKAVEGQFDVVLANINRNILLADMQAFTEKMKAHSTLLLSGFYKQDIPMLEKKAASLRLTKKAQQHDGDWACLRFEKN